MKMNPFRFLRRLFGGSRPSSSRQPDTGYRSLLLPHGVGRLEIMRFDDDGGEAGAVVTLYEPSGKMLTWARLVYVTDTRTTAEMKCFPVLKDPTEMNLLTGEPVEAIE